MTIRSRICLLFAVGAVALSCGEAFAGKSSIAKKKAAPRAERTHAGEDSFNTNAGPTAYVPTSESTANQAIDPKPAQFPSWPARVDYIHQNLPRKLQSYVRTADTYLAGTNEVIETPPSRFRVTTYFEFNYAEGFEFRLSPNFQMEVQLPNLESRWNVFLDQTRNDQLPGVDPTEQKQGAQLGVRKGLDIIPVQFEVGVDIAIPPGAYVQAEWNPEWIYGRTVLLPNVRGYYETADGFGSIGTLGLHRWFRGDKPRNVLSTRGSLKWSEQTLGVEYEATAGYAYIIEMLENKWNWRRTTSEHDVARGLFCRYTEFGHSSGETVANSRRVRLTYRCPLYKQWIYLDITPGLQWDREKNWDMESSLRFGIDMLFWGTPER